MDPPAPPVLAASGAHLAGPIIGLSVAIGIAGLQLGRKYIPRFLLRISAVVLGPVFAGLDRLHNAIVGDYVAWIVFGLIVGGGVLAVG